MLDAGYLVSVDRGEPEAQAFKLAVERSGRSLHTTSPVIAQVWRSGRTQARLAQFLKTITVHPFDDDTDGCRVGELLAASDTKDVVDAHLTLTASRLGLGIITGDAGDISTLAAAIPRRPPAVKAWP